MIDYKKLTELMNINCISGLYLHQMKYEKSSDAFKTIQTMIDDLEAHGKDELFAGWYDEEIASTNGYEKWIDTNFKDELEPLELSDYIAKYKAFIQEQNKKAA